MAMKNISLVILLLLLSAGACNKDTIKPGGPSIDLSIPIIAKYGYPKAINEGTVTSIIRANSDNKVGYSYMLTGENCTLFCSYTLTWEWGSDSTTAKLGGADEADEDGWIYLSSDVKDPLLEFYNFAKEDIK